MPPDESLTREQVEILEKWVAAGASWPSHGDSLAVVDSDARKHWAFQPVRDNELPSPEHDTAWVQTPIDAFVLRELNEHQLQPSPTADRHTLIRRVTYALTGLPPSSQAVADFINDQSPDAYQALVERLLESKEYGEHWARRWLDLARYSDTKGYVYAREERFWVHAWTYRDWVVKALNSDMRYDRFLLLQLAADQVADNREDLAAMGFLTLGRRFLGVQREIIDDRIDVVCRGTLGLTVACARCHDHKYDPVPTEDYYSLYGVFSSCMERLTSLEEQSQDHDFATELHKRQQALDEKLVEVRRTAAERVRSRVGDYLYAQAELSKYPPAGFDQVFSATDLLPTVVHRWEAYLRQRAKASDSIFDIWRRFATIPSPHFESMSIALTSELQQEADRHHPLVLAAFATPPKSFREVCDRYDALFKRVDQEWQLALQSHATVAAEQHTAPELSGLSDPAQEQMRQMLYAVDSPCVVPQGPVVNTEFYFDTGTIDLLWKLQGEVDRWILNAATAAPHALTLVDADVPSDPRVFKRGNPMAVGDEVPRQFLEVLSPADRQPFQHGSGRLELAQRIIDPSNPLTARVIVNRVWAAHFGNGLVTTTSGFGLRAEQPSHPELLDWLAANFVKQGWSLKQLHRWLLLSSTYQQCSHLGNITNESSDSHAAITDVWARAELIDPENRLLWRMVPRRLSFEEFRDSILAVSDELDRTIGGRPSDLFKAPFPKRRTLYGLVDRQFLPATLRVFDFANPDLHVANRSETTVPGQALFFMNDPWMLERARRLAADTVGLEPRQRVVRLVEHVFHRSPHVGEVDEALAFVAATEPTPDTSLRAQIKDWQYGYGRIDEQMGSVLNFQQLPFFSGSAWQGSAAYPDSGLGWVQLSARGGHPGNDLDHAAVRRFVAPAEMTLHVKSHLDHQPAEGDGVRYFVVHSRRGLLASGHIHQANQMLDIPDVACNVGDTLDFVIDIGGELNSDQFNWNVELAWLERGEGWHSENDFTPNTSAALNSWEQLVQVLLCSNEFLFVD